MLESQHITVELLHALELVEVVRPMSERSEPEISLKIKGLAGAVNVVYEYTKHSIHSKGQSWGLLHAMNECSYSRE